MRLHLEMDVVASEEAIGETDGWRGGGADVSAIGRCEVTGRREIFLPTGLKHHTRIGFRAVPALPVVETDLGVDVQKAAQVETAPNALNGGPTT